MSAILGAIFAGKPEVAERLAAGRDDLDLAEAAALNRLPRVRQILRERPEAVLEHGADGFTALHYAAHLGHADVARALVLAGADLAAVARHKIDATPLHSAVAGRQTAIAKMLIEAGAQVDATYEGGNTALHAAAAAGDLATVKMLVEAGAARDVPNGEGKLAADLAKGEVAAFLEGG
jgi:ankyrin repeat protein